MNKEEKGCADFKQKPDERLASLPEVGPSGRNVISETYLLRESKENQERNESDPLSKTQILEKCLDALGP